MNCPSTRTTDGVLSPHPDGAVVIGHTARMQDLFGEMPAARVAAAVSIVYATAAAEGQRQ